MYNFQMEGVLDFKGDEKLRQDVEDNLVLGDVDVSNVTFGDGEVEVQCNPSDFEKAKDVLKGMPQLSKRVENQLKTVNVEASRFT